MTLHLALIVEGQTEQQCVERLLQRVWRELLNAPERLNVLPPSRTKRDAFLQTDSEAFVKKIEEASIKLTMATRRGTDSRGSLFILLDAERACPRSLAPRVLAAAEATRRDIDIACIFANRQFETGSSLDLRPLVGSRDFQFRLKFPMIANQSMVKLTLCR